MGCPAALPRTVSPRLDREIANKAQGTNMQITEDRKLAARLQVRRKLPLPAAQGALPTPCAVYLLRMPDRLEFNSPAVHLTRNIVQSLSKTPHLLP